jgi:hypothetical protein
MGILPYAKAIAEERCAVPDQPTKGTSPLYLELPAELRQRLDAFVLRNRRKLKGEVTNAIEQYLDREEAREGRPTPAPPALPPAEDRGAVEGAPPARKGKRRKPKGP